MHRYDPVALEAFAVDRIEMAIAVGVQPGFSVLLVGDDDGFVRTVIVPGIVRRVLEMPLDGAAIWINGNGRSGVQIIAWANTRVEVRHGITDTPQDIAGFLVV